ncbi:MAG: hypothetical protein HC825_01070 [Oscillatoriales cyanobacterium RM1_1_9]|nr:hypothetical protein [Oscillatoriales cyanobacterium SM2_3_0]NJO45651.1 hypothetical protein [Oscillatoriales cyanobacterium RM2_1_1]NJO70677.1 hypothetical protein [Oscillatoriales cyanobacterium RM1_1_9]
MKNSIQSVLFSIPLVVMASTIVNAQENSSCYMVLGTSGYQNLENLCPNSAEPAVESSALPRSRTIPPTTNNNGWREMRRVGFDYRTMIKEVQNGSSRCLVWDARYETRASARSIGCSALDERPAEKPRNRYEGERRLK